MVQLGQYFHVKIEFQRIQTYLFAARRLRDMVGANVLLGEVIRVELLDLLVSKYSKSLVDLTALGSTSPPASKLSFDPLNAAVASGHDFDLDDPSALYKIGVLSRDGGHFWVIFSDETEANGFSKEAAALISRRLPGLIFSIEVIDLDSVFARNARGGTHAYGRAKPQSASESQVVSSPMVQDCEASELGYASVSNKAGGELVSQGVQLRRDAYRKLRGKPPYDGKSTRDIVGLLGLHGANLKDDMEEDDFHTLCGRDYLAVIVADGNDIGARALRSIGVEQGPNATSGMPSGPTSMVEFVSREMAMEAFFQKTRVTLRKAVSEAITTVFGQAGSEFERKYKLLMLGGDDLLMVCPAGAAPGFVEELSRHVKALEPDSDGLTLGIGVAFTAPNVPFHHAHATAEELASSAKRLYRRYREEGSPCSTVDWMLETGSWSPDPIELRLRDSVARLADGSIITTSCRPVPLMDGDEGAEVTNQVPSFSSLLSAAEALAKQVEGDADSKSVSRSRLHAFAEDLIRGKEWSTYQLKSSAPGFQKALDSSCGIKSENLWQEVVYNFHRTTFRDIFELMEIVGMADRRTTEGPKP